MPGVSKTKRKSRPKSYDAKKTAAQYKAVSRKVGKATYTTFEKVKPAKSKRAKKTYGTPVKRRKR